MQRHIIAILAAFAALIAAVVIAMFIIGVSIDPDRIVQDDVINLTPLIWGEFIGGILGGAIGALLCRRIARSRRTVLIFAAAVLLLGLLEGAAILIERRFASAYTIIVPVWLLLLSPCAAAAVIALTGALPARRASPA
ncbi:MAG: hypothetical protein VYC34_04075 [Planctomycetota bacterium]|nr:hypothetical protein [Planctomycetota bacterium]